MLSSLAFVTIGHMAAGVVIAAVLADPARPGSRVGLLAVATGFASVAVSAVLLIHQRRIASPWLMLALVPPIVGGYFIF